MNDYEQFDADVYDESNLPAPREILGSDEVITPWDAFMSEPVRIGKEEIGMDSARARATGYDAHYEIGDDAQEPQIEDEAAGLDGHYEIGNTEIGDDDEVGANVEIGDDELGANTEIGQALAVRAVLEKARDNRSPAPPMRALDVDAPGRDYEDDWLLTGTCIGAAADSGNPNPYPLLTKYMQKAGAGMPPRIVQVDTEESYRTFRAAGSPEMAAFHEKLDDLERKFAAHSRDPYAHERLADELDDLTWLGAEADEALAEKRVEMDLLPGAEGKHDSWTDGEDIFSSIKIPHEDGGVWWLTSAEPWDKSVKEASRHAAESNASASAVGEIIPAIGERLGAATAIKEMVAAVPSILARPEAKGTSPFVVRIEPAMSPALCALVLLALDCAAGNAQACDEWNRLGVAAPPQIQQAMAEAAALLKKKA